MTWRRVDHFEDGTPAIVAWWEIDGRDCRIYLEPRPPYCDRGNWLAKIDLRCTRPHALNLDWCDGWPRYYFDFERARLEIEAWLEKRGQAI